MSTKTSIALGALLAASAACSLPAAAGSEQQQQDGMVVVRDARTGQLRNATPAEVKALRAQQDARGMARPAAEPVVTIRKDGTLHKHLGERGMVYSVVTPDAKGKLDMQCVNGADAAEAAVRHPAPAPHQEHKHESR